jgi:hypothetical protein
MNEFDLKDFLYKNSLLKEEQKEIEEGKAAYEYEKGKEAGEKIEKEKMEESEEITETPKLTKEGLKNMIKEKITSILNEEEEDVIDDEVVIDDEEIIDDTEEEIPSAPVSGGKDVDAILDLLTKAREESESLGDEKLSDQIGNTITFLTRTHLSR